MRSILSRQARPILAFAILFVLLGYFLTIHPRGLSVGVMLSWSNQGAALALLAIGQTIVVMSRGIDLSIGPVMALSNCLASHLLTGSPVGIAGGIAVILIVGALCGALNGLVIVLGRLQSIIATLASSAIFSGLALLVRPIPGGQVDPALAETMTSAAGGIVPVSLLVILAGLCLWFLIRKRPVGRTIVAAGSSETAAFASGLPVRQARVLAYALSGLFAALGGLFISFQTLSGDPSIGLSYTLNSIAAVVIGGTALSGGLGTVAGSVAGALILRTIGSLVFFNDIDPMAQPFFEGAVLLAAVSFGAFRLLGIKNRLEVFR